MEYVNCIMCVQHQVTLKWDKWCPGQDYDGMWDRWARRRDVPAKMGGMALLGLQAVIPVYLDHVKNNKS